MDDVIGRDDALHVSRVVDDRNRDQAGALKEPAHVLLRGVIGDGDDGRPHDVAHALPGVRVEQLPERHHADQALIGLEHVAVVDRLDLLAALLPEVGHRLVHRHLRPQAREARVHQPARAVFGIRQEPSHLVARRLVEQGEQRIPFERRRCLNQVGRIVGREEPNPRAALALRETQHQSNLIGRGQREEHVFGLRPREQQKSFDPVLL